jgi:glucose-1-phosphate thymidylyltransferase
MGFIDAEQVRRLAEPLRKNAYGEYLVAMVDGEGTPAGGQP